MGRWQTAPVTETDGMEGARDTAIPLGEVISPLLANLFLYCAFDK